MGLRWWRGLAVAAIGIALAVTVARQPGNDSVLRTIPLAQTQTPVNMQIDTRTGRTFVATSGAGGGVATFNTRSGRALRRVPMPNPAVLLVDEQSGHVFVGDRGSGPATTYHLTMLDARSGIPLRRISIAGAPEGMALDAHGARVYVAVTTYQCATWPACGGNSMSQIEVLDARGGQVLRALAVPGQVAAVAVDGRRHLLIVVSNVSDTASEIIVLDALSAM